MQLMAWSDHFLTGFDAIDAQHKRLVDLINGAASLLVAPGARSAEQVQPLLSELAQYAQTHFAYEEALMAQIGVGPDHQNHHRSAHAAFTQEVGRMQQQLQQDGNLSGTELLRFLTSWLTFHILSEDMEMARQLRLLQAGMSAQQLEQQGAATQPSSAHAALNAALIDLFALLSQRNRSLAMVNDQLRATQAELAATNQQLESRVQQRTAELAAAHSALAVEHQSVRDALHQLQQAQVQIMQSEKMAAVGQLAAGIAHEINNPIGFVSSNLGTLAGYTRDLFDLIATYEARLAALGPASPAPEWLLPSPPQVDLPYLRQDVPELLAESLDGLNRVKRIVADLKDFAHVDESLWHDADLNLGMESTLNVVWHEIKNKADVVKQLGTLPRVHCIASQINQVFMNLLMNAAQAIGASGTRGTITLRSGVAGDQVWFEVQDTGVGMSPLVQQRIFEPFYTTKPVGQGTGLGLSISWDIVMRHQGKLEVRSEVGHGSTFRMTLPIKGRIPV